MPIAVLSRLDAAILSRFNAKVDRRGLAECWLWTASKNPAGYGQFHLLGRTTLATHIALYAAGRDRPDKAIAMHSCDNPACVNPAHLAWSTQARNVADCIAKGRVNPARGVRKPTAILNDRKVRQIRASALSERKAAAAFGVSRRTIRSVRLRATWTHVTDEEN